MTQEHASAHLLTLYRPVGLAEMQLILESEARVFPPRLPEQPFFYPVLTFEYANQIARDLNTKYPPGYAGFVTEFKVDKAYADRFEVHTVGASIHRELWIPAEQLDEFNRHIQGRIEIVAAHYGGDYKGAKHWYKDWYADEMLIALHYASANPHDFHGEMYVNRHAIQLNFRYWIDHDFSERLTAEQQTELLRLIVEVWRIKFPDFPLLGSEMVE